LVEIENEFQNICSKYTLSKNQILNEKSLLSNNLKPYVPVYLKDKNKHLNINHEDEIYTYHFQELWLEETFLNNFSGNFAFFVNKKIHLVFPIFGFSLLQCPLLMHDLFTLAGFKLLLWLHWKHDFT
jgi:hypothetical protein